MKSFKMVSNKEAMGDVQNTVSSSTGAKIILALIFIGLFAWYFYGGGLENATNQKMDTIKQQVASDSVDQYNIAKRNGNKVDMCVHAGLVAAAYMQAKDEANYNQWRQTETTDCANMTK